MNNSNLAIIFPGQGSQSIGMLADLATNFPSVQTCFAQASDALGYNLWQLCQQGPEQQLNQTEFTQPALLAASVAIWQILQQQFQLTPKILAGHSLGEYSALVCADAIDFIDAIKLVQLRGQLMQQACPEGFGAMAAIVGLDDATVAELCQQASNQQQQVTPANFNSIGQAVVAGHTTAVEAVVIAAKTQGAKIAKVLPVSVPSHSLLMKSAADKLAEALALINIKTPQIAVLHNVNADYCQDPNMIRELLAKQLYSPVLWTLTQQKIAEAGISQMIEAGPGKVLTGLAKRTIPAVSCVAINDVNSLGTLPNIFEA